MQGEGRGAVDDLAIGIDLDREIDRFQLKFFLRGVEGAARQAGLCGDLRLARLRSGRSGGDEEQGGERKATGQHGFRCGVHLLR